MSRSFWLPALPVVLALLVAGPAAAATFTVTNLADSGPGSLRQTVLDANAAAGADEVTFAPVLSGTITLTTDQIAITDPLVVSGPGIGVLTISGNDLFRIFLIEKPAVDAPIDDHQQQLGGGSGRQPAGHQFYTEARDPGRSLHLRQRYAF